MTVASLTGPFIQAAGYSRGRAKGSILWLVLHTAEGSTEVNGLGGYFHGTKAGSSNSGIGQQGEYADYVSFNNTPWTNPPINSQSDTAEICAFKRWTRAEWLAHPKCLETTAHWVAWRASVRSIPIRHITGAQARAGLKGVLSHKEVNDGFHASDHTDVGDGFPWDVVISRAQAMAGLSKPLPAHVSYTKEGDPILGLTTPLMGPNQDIINVQHAFQVLGNKLALTGVYDRPTADITNIYKAHRGITEAGFGEQCWAHIRADLKGKGQ